MKFLDSLPPIAPLLDQARRASVLAALVPALAAPSAADVLHGPVTNPANGHSYYLLTQNTWTASEAEAVGLGGHLVTINDAAENQWVLDTFGNHGGSAKALWIALTDRVTEGTFTWTSGETPIYMNWADGEPSAGSDGEDFAHLYEPGHAGGLGGKWNVHTDADSESGVPLHGVVEVRVVVSNVRAAQRSGTNLVDIDYDVTGTILPVRVSLEVSDDDGATFAVPVSSVTGAVGRDVAPGADLRMTWDAGADWAGHATARARFRITADDDPPPPGFARIPAGWFTMGRTSGDTDSDAPPVNVYVSEFYMATHEVTWELWNDVRNWAVNHGYTDIATGGGKGATHPVHSVNWWDVVKWCNARSEKDGLTPVYRNAGGTVFKIGTEAPTPNWNANGYRLPTEAEWEKAARGGVAGRRFPWGDTITHSQANYLSSSSYNYDVSTTRGYHPTYNDGTWPFTSPVGSFAPNGYGLYDMADNVWEWNWDWHSASTYTEGASNPRGPSSGSSRVLRGSYFAGHAPGCRSANRGKRTPGYSWSYYGFRPARSSVP